MSQSVLLIDVRRPEEYATGHIKDAVNVNFEDEAAFVEEVKNLQEMHDITLYCLSGFRSAYAASLLAAKHGVVVKNLEGGLTLYQGELVTEE